MRSVYLIIALPVAATGVLAYQIISTTSVVNAGDEHSHNTIGCVDESCATIAESISVAEAIESIQYRRRDWRHWIDEDKDCQTTRAEVLIRESQVEVTFKDEKECVVVAGLWVDAYTGLTYEQASSMDVDHIVPLAWANDRGGHTWDPQQRERFANDMENLTAVHASSNRSKGSKVFDQWLPAQTDFACEYMELFANVVSKYELSLHEDEVSRFEEIHEGCF
jgi:hypothetical protein